MVIITDSQLRGVEQVQSWSGQGMPVTADSVLEGVMATHVEGLGNGSTRKDIMEKLEIVRDKVFEESPGDPICSASQPSHKFGLSWRSSLLPCC